MTGSGELCRQAAFPVEVVDTTGAGDAFHGAFAWAISEGLKDAECARIASAVAAISCKGLGARAGSPHSKPNSSSSSKLVRFHRDICPKRAASRLRRGKIVSQRRVVCVRNDDDKHMRSLDKISFKPSAVAWRALCAAQRTFEKEMPI